MDALTFDSIQLTVPQAVLIIGGLFAVLIAVSYAKDKDGGRYKIMMVLGFLVGIAMLVEALALHKSWDAVTASLIAITAFALLIRPFRDVNFSVVAALLIAALVYLWLGTLDGQTLFGNIDLSFLAKGAVRIIIALILGAIVYGICRFAEAVVKLFGKILNCWPVLLVLGLICIAQAVLMMLGYESVLDLIDRGAVAGALELNL